MLGSRIAFLRRSAGLSQAALAKKLNLSASAVGMYEQGRRQPSLDILIAISKEFGVTVDYLAMGQTTAQRDITTKLVSLPIPQTLLCSLSREDLITLLVAQLI